MEQRRRIERPERAKRRDQKQRKRLSTARRNAFTTDTDIISDLPDSLLSHILSFLPTRDSVATSILSSRWRPLWTLVPALHLDQRKLTENRNYSFADIVSGIWTVRDAISNPMPLHKLSIYWYQDCLPSDVNTWLRATNLRDLQELYLYIFTDVHQPLELPRSIYFSTALVVLKLISSILLDPPPACVLPCLRILVLTRVKFANRDSLSTFLTACPVLLTLSLTMYDVNFEHWDEFNVVVLVPTLKTLHLHWHVLSSSIKFQINTPALEYFNFRGFLNGDNVVENLPNVVECVLQFEQCVLIDFEDYAKRLRDFMGPLCNVISMEFSTTTAQILCRDSNREDGHTFYNLSSLKLFGGSSSEWYAWHEVRLLLFRAPKLQMLAFEWKHLLGLNIYKPNPCLEEPLDVPECLSSHLTTCHYKGFEGKEEEMELVRQILKAAKVLKLMKITVTSYLGLKLKLLIREKLEKFQRSSQSCEIAFEELRFT
ncbi:hypothetical protein ACB092_01G024700 [Castanea dentata]